MDAEIALDLGRKWSITTNIDHQYVKAYVDDELDTREAEMVLCNCPRCQKSIGIEQQPKTLIRERLRIIEAALVLRARLLSALEEPALRNDRLFGPAGSAVAGTQGQRGGEHGFDSRIPPVARQSNNFRIAALGVYANAKQNWSLRRDGSPLDSKPGSNLAFGDSLVSVRV
jgi:hypothetical protein